MTEELQIRTLSARNGYAATCRPRDPASDHAAMLDDRAIPGTRLELVYPEGWGILSPLRLPIPPPGQDDRANVTASGGLRESVTVQALTLRLLLSGRSMRHGNAWARGT